MIKEYHVSENLLSLKNGIYDNNGVTITITDNNNISFSGVATASGGRNLKLSDIITLPAGEYRYKQYGGNAIAYIQRNSDDTIYYGALHLTEPTAVYLGINFTNGTDYSGETMTIMLNRGTSDVNYEPYGNTWNTKSYCKATTGSKTYSNFPIVVRSREQSIPIWSMKGNEQHTGTASPTSPIEINGAGERTANLMNVSTQNVVFYNDYPSSTYNNFTINNNVVTLEANKAAFFAIPTKVEENTTYYVRAKSLSGSGFTYRVRYYSDLPNNRSDNFISSAINTTIVGTYTNSITTPQGCKYILTELYHDPSQGEQTVGELMVSSSSDYEPYGYKIPISANDTELTPIYLTEQLMKINDYADSLASSGTVTYNIRKLVITGEETGWSQDGTSGSNNRYRLNLSNVKNTATYITDFYNSHFKVQVGYAANTSVIWYGGSQYVYISVPSSDYPTLTDFKTWLQGQYTAGTPLTVYYIRETPTTEAVTVPTIPTTSSPTTIDINTSVKPSEMSLTYDGYKICKPTKIVIPEPSEWIAKSWNGYNGMVGSSIWSDGDNIYYSMAMYQYVLNKSTSTWSAKTWNGLTSFNGAHIWTDGDNIYYSFGNDQYVLNRQTSTWSAKTWNGLASFDGGYVWTDGNNVYYSNSSNQYILDKATSTWVEKEWNGLTSFDGSDVWFEGNNIYYSYGLTRYVLNKSTSTWSEKVWTSAPYNMYGVKVWSVNGYTFYSNGTYEQYVLNKSTSTWSTKTWTGFTSFSGGNIWTDGTNIYASDGIGKQYVLVR